MLTRFTDVRVAEMVVDAVSGGRGGGICGGSDVGQSELANWTDILSFATGGANNGACALLTTPALMLFICVKISVNYILNAF